MTDRKRVLLTGATGFLGYALAPALADDGYIVRTATRSPVVIPKAAEGVIVGDLRWATNLSAALSDVHAVVHLAGIERPPPGTGEDAYEQSNLLTTQKLAESAARAGVERFVFLSSVRAQVGPRSDQIITEDLPPLPTNAYGRSKLRAEEAIRDSGVPAVILRPALVHGPGMRLNMAALLRLALTPYPLPVRSFRAKRSIVSRNHLLDAVLLALRHPGMTGQTYLVADPEPLSTAEMLGIMRSAAGRRPGLIPFPPALAKVGARLIGREDEMAYLGEPLVIDPAKLLRSGWKPRLTTREALAETARVSAASHLLRANPTPGSPTAA